MESSTQRLAARGALIASLLAFAGCASVPGEPDPRDPLESYNRAAYQFNDAVDRAVLRPVAEVYEQLPDPVNRGVTNFFSNLNDVVVIINDLLQLKLEQAVSDLGRLTFNTTVGLGGLIDVATHMQMPKHHEDFGQTLGYWGMPTGPYLVIPLLGPSSARDFTGGAVDTMLVDPVTFVEEDGDEDVAWSMLALRVIDTRADLLPATRVVEKAALDPYIFIRESYFQRRAALVNDGQVPAPGGGEDSFDKILEEDRTAEQGGRGRK